MPYTVEILRRAEKALRDLTDRKLYHRLREAIDVLARGLDHMGAPSSAVAKISTASGSGTTASFTKSSTIAC
jgi:hypothetical protein